MYDGGGAKRKVPRVYPQLIYNILHAYYVRTCKLRKRRLDGWVYVCNIFLSGTAYIQL